MLEKEKKSSQQISAAYINGIPKSQQYSHFAGESFQNKAVQYAQIEMAAEQRQQNQILLDFVNKQQEANNIQKQSNELLKQQIEFLKESNKAQEKALKREKAWSIFAWIVTTLIAIASVCSDFISV